jgi:hypothetical protein
MTGSTYPEDMLKQRITSNRCSSGGWEKTPIFGVSCGIASSRCMVALLRCSARLMGKHSISELVGLIISVRVGKGRGPWHRVWLACNYSLELRFRNSAFWQESWCVQCWRRLPIEWRLRADRLTGKHSLGNLGSPRVADQAV